MNKLKISIRTRLLAYFLFATLIPLLVLAIIISITIQSGLYEFNFDQVTLDSLNIQELINLILEKTRNNVSNIIFKVAVIISVASILLSYTFSKLVIKPIKKLSEIAEAIESGDFTQRIEIKTDDEIGSLSQSFNSMSNALEKRSELEKSRENLVAMITHDLKVPLLASVRTLDYMKKGSYGELNEKQAFITEQLIKNQNDLLDMVKTIVDTYKYEDGKYILDRQLINVSSLIEESVNEVKSLAIEKNHNLTYKTGNNAEIFADRQEIKRVIINLLSNAITYTNKNGNINIYTQLNPDNLTIFVEDNGIGIEEELQKRLFEKYSTNEKSLKKIGTGLGLYLTRHIINAHNGTIGVKSIKDKGSTFYFSLPVK